MKITIDKAVNDFLKKRELIKSGVKMTLNTGFNNLNQITANGLMKNTVNVIAAHSGVGKTALSLMLAHNFLAVNEKLKILFFTLEMPSEAIIARFVSRFEEKTVLQLNTEQDIEISDKTLNIIKNLDITFYEYAGTVSSIYNKISEFATANSEYHCLVMLDHSLLIDGDGENQKITDLANILNSCKKDFKNTTYLILSQLNDAMYNPSRLTSSKNVYPIYTDLYYGFK